MVQINPVLTYALQHSLHVPTPHFHTLSAPIVTTMPKLSFITLDVFTKTRYLGNPLAVVKVPAGRDVSTETMQTIAREFNLSETIFIHERQSKAEDVPEWSVRIFVTEREIPFAGHPTIGSACYALGTLANNTRKGRLICNAGPIELDYADGEAKASIPHNFHRHTQHPFSAQDVYAFQPALKNAEAPKSIDLVSPVKGMNFISIELSNLETLAKVEISGSRPSAKLDDEWDEGLTGAFFYVITDNEKGLVKLRTRMLLAAIEDPATGSASCGLCAFLAMKFKAGRTTKFELTQAVEMGRKSDIGVEVTLTDSMDAVEKIELSGTAVKVTEGALEYD